MVADTSLSVASAAGMVVALQANYLEVELDAAPAGCPGRLLCTRRTRLSHRGEAVFVGDRVCVEAIAGTCHGVVEGDRLDCPRSALRGLDGAVSFRQRRTRRQPEIDIEFALRELRDQFCTQPRHESHAAGEYDGRAGDHGCPVIQLRPQDVKLKIACSRSASKGALQNMIEHQVGNAREMLLPLAKSHQNHASDALAVALASQSHPLVQTVKRMRG